MKIRAKKKRKKKIRAICINLRKSIKYTVEWNLHLTHNINLVYINILNVKKSTI